MRIVEFGRFFELALDLSSTIVIKFRILNTNLN